MLALARLELPPPRGSPVIAEELEPPSLVTEMPRPPPLPPPETPLFDAAMQASLHVKTVGRINMRTWWLRTRTHG